MKTSIVIYSLILVAGISGLVEGQHRNSFSRNVPCDSCDGQVKNCQRTPNCACKKCKQKTQHIHIELTAEQIKELVKTQAVAPAQTVATQQVQTGQFIAPPATGTISEESVTTGWRGMSLRFPEFKIGLPSLELPSRYRVRHPKRMKVDSTSATYVPAGHSQVVTSGQQFMNAQLIPAQMQQMANYQLMLQQQQAALNKQTAAEKKQVSDVTATRLAEIEKMAAQLAEKEKLLESRLAQYNQLLEAQQSQRSQMMTQAQPICDEGCDAIPTATTNSVESYPVFNQAHLAPGEFSIPQPRVESKGPLSSVQVDPNLLDGSN
ncbi:MAG: hypothetical protein AAGA30_05275 [Planctomycetota bacterium]